MEFQVLPREEAARLREGFVRRFVDTDSGHYNAHIGRDGYLWDCLKDNEGWRLACTQEEAAALLAGKGEVLAMWDTISAGRVGADRRLSLAYPGGTVIRMAGPLLGRTAAGEWDREAAAWRDGLQCQGLWLPEDLYCFDESLSWFVIFTHEGWDSWTDPGLDEDAYIRVCFRSE